MKKSVLISLIALGISLIGLIIALAAWLHKKNDLDCDDFDDDLLMDDDEDMEYIASQYIEHDIHDAEEPQGAVSEETTDKPDAEQPAEE